MTRVLTGLYHLLSTATAVTDIVADRIYPGLIQEDRGYPAIAMIVDSVDTQYVKEGVTDLNLSDVDIYCIGHTYGQVSELAEEVRDSLQDVRGTTAAGQHIQHITFEDLWDDSIKEDKANLFRLVLSFRIRSNRSL